MLRMFFLTLSNRNMLLVEKKLTWQLYTLAKALPTTKRVWIINQKEFATTALDLIKKAFIIFVPYLRDKMIIMLVVRLK